MLKKVRENITRTLWQQYRQSTHDVITIEHALFKNGITQLPLDHFAMIDLPGPHTGISVLANIFQTLGYEKKGEGYLAEKQNDFMWMAEENCSDLPAHTMSPQVVVADFRLEELPIEIKKIVARYAALAAPAPLASIKHLAAQSRAHDIIASEQLHNTVTQYLTTRAWPLPTTKEFETVKEFNELLAWVLVFGHVPNHFTLSIHLLSSFDNLMDFHQYLQNTIDITLNPEGGVIKGGKHVGIEQSSTAGKLQKITLADGDVELPYGFIEFVWRFPCASVTTPTLWKDYFTGFVATHANRVIESLYVNK